MDETGNSMTPAGPEVVEIAGVPPADCPTTVTPPRSTIVSAWAASPSRAAKPLPRTGFLAAIIDYLQGEIEIRVRAGAMRIDHGNGETVAGGFRQAYVPRHDGSEAQVREVCPDLKFHLSGQRSTNVHHCQHQPADPKCGIETFSHRGDSREELGQSLEREVLGLDRYYHLVRSNKCIDCEKSQ